MGQSTLKPSDEEEILARQFLTLNLEIDTVLTL